MQPCMHRGVRQVNNDSIGVKVHVVIDPHVLYLKN